MNRVLILLCGLVLPLGLPAQTYTVLKSFSAPDSVYGTNYDGAGPKGSLVSSGGTLYGTTESGGTNGYGALYKVNMDGTGFTLLRGLTFEDGSLPAAGLVLDGATLYGVTDGGGNMGFLSRGTVFKLDTNGMGYTVLKNFSGSSGAHPDARLQLSGDTLYGTTFHGGSVDDGAVFQVKTNGSFFAIVTNFTGVRGAFPLGGVTLVNGFLYGTTTQGGGSSDYGVLYKVSTNGTGMSIPRIFTNSPDGSSPRTSLVADSATLYGTTWSGGAFGDGTIFKINFDGSGYVILKSFTTNNLDGANPSGDLILNGGVLFGVTYQGGSSGNGTVFRLRTDGSDFAVIKTFSATSNLVYGINSDGANPVGGLLFSGNRLYGTTFQGGPAGRGVVFSISLSPEILVNDKSFGIRTNRFGFSVSGISNQTIVVEASASPTTGLWVPLQTNKLGSAPYSFTDPLWTNYPTRFYRARSQ